MRLQQIVEALAMGLILLLLFVPIILIVASSFSTGGY